MAAAIVCLTDGGFHTWPLPKIHKKLPARPARRIERKGNVRSAAARTEKTNPLLYAPIIHHDHFALFQCGNVRKRLLRRREHEEEEYSVSVPCMSKSW